MLAQATGPQDGGLVAGIIGLVVIVVTVAGLWRTFTKAGEPGWKAVIPLYNVYVLLRLAGYGVGASIGLTVLYLVPIIDLVVAVIVNIKLARRFGKGAWFGVGMGLLGFVFYPILGFGDATYATEPIPGTA